jgi:nucleoside-diphosphate kinase
MNLVHASDGPEASAREINLYFKPEEILPYDPTLIGWLKAEDEK